MEKIMKILLTILKLKEIINRLNEAFQKMLVKG
jgi:hypothetical protein